MTRAIAISLLLVLALSCGDGQTEAAEARAFFQQRYPYAELLDVRIAKKQDTARVIVFRYRKSGQEQINEVAIQFVKDPSTSRWSPEPEEPRSLP